MVKTDVLPTSPADSAAHLIQRLKRLGVASWPQVLLCLPKSYQDFSVRSTLQQAMPREGVMAGQRLFQLAVCEPPVIMTQPKKRIMLTATDGMHTVKIAVFIVPGVDVAYWKSLEVGNQVCLLAALQSWAGRLQITGPTVVPVDLVGRVVPKYPSRRGVVAADALFDATRHAVNHHLDHAASHIVASFDGLSEADILRLARIEAGSLSELLSALHSPGSMAAADEALALSRRLAAFSVVHHASRMKRRNPLPESVLPIKRGMVEKLIARLPHPLTGDQRKAIDEIVIDLESPYPMRRVLSGDTGSGKTYSFMVPALAAQIIGKRVAILTPNAPLADQFVAECREAYGEQVPVRAITAARKTDINLEGNPILVGTTALLSRFRELGESPDFLVVDEQQRFGVAQKSELVDDRTNLLEATATPIPRTTALITHGGLDVSIIRESPVVKNVVTRIVAAGDAKRLFGHTRKILAAGGQVAVVYPIVRDQKQERKSVEKAFERWSKEFPGRVGMVHGAMKEEEKTEAIVKLKSGEHAVGIVSSIIEIGLTLPLLKSMVVVNAERYGVSTLHQLRGRLARKGGNGYFFLYLPDEVSEDTLARMRLVEECDDGFELAERDANMRGYGDLVEDAERQHGKSTSTLFIGASLTPEDIHQFANIGDI